MPAECYGPAGSCRTGTMEHAVPLATMGTRGHPWVHPSAPTMAAQAGQHCPGRTAARSVQLVGLTSGITDFRIQGHE